MECKASFYMDVSPPSPLRVCVAKGDIPAGKGLNLASATPTLLEPCKTAGCADCRDDIGRCLQLRAAAVELRRAWHQTTDRITG